MRRRGCSLTRGEDTCKHEHVRILTARDQRFAHHPSAHGGFTLELNITDGVVTHAEVLVGNVHRSAEKLFESREYRQAMMLANRHDWTSPFTGELGLAIAVERALGIEVPERARSLRTLLSEMFRLNAAMLFLDGFAERRESLLTLFEQYCGQRVHPMAARIGGLAFDATDEWLAAVSDYVAQPFETASLRSHAAAFTNVGVLPDAGSFGVSGPVARAAGISLDARYTDPYDAYPIGDTLPTYVASDTAARIEAMCDSLEQSVALVRTLSSSLPSGPVNVRLPKVVKLPEGVAMAAVESAIGTNRTVIVSDATKHPVRLKLRTASFNNAAALSTALVGTDEALVAPVVKSFFLVPGDIDR